MLKVFHDKDREQQKGQKLCAVQQRVEKHIKQVAH